jgi:hypothetical protein
MIEDFAIPHDVWEAALKVSNYAKQQNWGNDWCIADVSSRNGCEKLRSICNRIYIARNISLNPDIIIECLEEIDALFREENMN